MERKPLVGVLPLYDPRKNSYWMLPQYLQALSSAGALPVILSPRMTEAEQIQTLTLCQGLLFPGGQDIDPSLYGEKRLPGCAPSEPQRDELEFPLFTLAYRQNMPVLGICRGMQLFNAALGGTLYQHLPAQYPQAMEHDMTAPYNRVFHQVALTPGSPLARRMGKLEMGVNSYHHQAVKDLAVDLAVMATAPDGVIEAVYAPGRQFVWGIQWHPEYFWQGEQGVLFQAFVEQCRRFIR